MTIMGMLSRSSNKSQSVSSRQSSRVSRQSRRNMTLKLNAEESDEEMQSKPLDMQSKKNFSKAESISSISRGD